jgi:hypothetical protein
MKSLFFAGGLAFMSILTLLLIATIVWIIYHFIVAYHSNEINIEKELRMIGYGKTIGLFSMIVGITGQMNGLYGMFSAIADVTSLGEAIKPELVFEGIRVTMICTLYGILIYLFSLLLCLVASVLIERKKANQLSI